MAAIRFSMAFSILLAAVLVLPGCTMFPTQSEHGRDVDFAAFDTYAWPASAPTETGGATGVDDLLVQEIRDAVDRELASKGMRRVAEEDASLLVQQYTGVELKTLYHDPYYAFNEVEIYEQGTLTIEFIDARAQQPVWRGSAEGHLREIGEGSGLSPSRVDRDLEPRNWRVQEMVHAILAKYPPK